MTLGVGTGQRGLPEPSLDLIKKLWRVASLFFYGDRRAKARFLLVIVLVLSTVCAGFPLFFVLHHLKATSMKRPSEDNISLNPFSLLTDI
jgi:ABC-type uncharacterized transport system fused permease/ATPase subunit